MGSRVRKGKHRLFELLVEIKRSTNNPGSNSISFSFPTDYKDEELLKSIPEFAFPFATDFISSAVDHFTFVLTDIDSKFRFGFCRLSAQSETCLCLVSYYPWFEVFYQLLNHIAEIQSSEDDNDFVTLLSFLSEVDATTPGVPICATNKQGATVFAFTVPDTAALPSIPDNRNLTEYYSAIDSYNMMIIFASMLFERRIIVTSKKLSRLTACVHGAAGLFYPFHWQHLYIPVLPPHLVDYCCAPMPYLIGIHSTLLSQVSKTDLGDTVILNADANSVTNDFDDLASMPPKIVSFLKRQLRAHKKNKVANPCVLMGQTVSLAFLQTLVHLLGGYRCALVEQDGNMTFDAEAFLQSSSQSMQPFLERLLHLQAFEQFIHERKQFFQEDPNFVDRFETEVHLYKTNEKTNKAKHKMMWPKYEKTLTGIANKVKTTGINTLKTVKTTLNDICAIEFKVPRNLNTETDVKIVVTPASNDKTLTNPNESDKRKCWTLLRHDAKTHSGGLLEANRHHSFRLSTDDSQVLDVFLQQSSMPLLSESDMEKMFRKYSCDNLLSSTASLSDDSSISRISSATEDLSLGRSILLLGSTEPLQYHYSDVARMSTSAPAMAEHVTEKSVVEVATIKSSKTSEKMSASTVSQVSEASFSKSSENFEQIKYTDSGADLVKRCDKMIEKEAGQSNFYNQRKNRLSVRYLPNVRQMIQKYEGSSVNSPSTISASRYHGNDLSESLVSRQAGHYMSLDRNARLEVHFDVHNSHASKSLDNGCSRKTLDHADHKMLSNKSSNNSITSINSVF